MAGAGWNFLDDWDTWGVFLGLSAINLAILVARTPAGIRLRGWAGRTLRRISWGGRIDWLDWRPLTLVAAAWFGGFAAFHLLSGQYGCLPNGLISDPLGELDSGRAFWAGRNPFESVPYCGGTLSVPYGLAAVLLDALGSLGGLAGILVVWGIVALSVLPLATRTASTDREYVTAFVATSVIYVPLITAEFSGATNAIVPVTLLASVYLARRRERVAALVGGFLATARFPSVFPVLGSTGAFARHRFASFGVGAGAFLAATAVSYVVWGSGFASSVFVSQITRRNNSLNFYGILLLHSALPTAMWIEAVQAGAILAIVIAVFFTVRSPIGAVAITITGVALVTPFLAFNFLIWLLPVALAGVRARWWLWGIASVGWINANLGFATWVPSGIVLPTEGMDLVLSGLLVGLMIDLWREERTRSTRPTPSEGPATTASPGLPPPAPSENPAREGTSGSAETAEFGPASAGSYPPVPRPGVGTLAGRV